MQTALNGFSFLRDNTVVVHFLDLSCSRRPLFLPTNHNIITLGGHMSNSIPVFCLVLSLSPGRSQIQHSFLGLSNSAEILEEFSHLKVFVVNCVTLASDCIFQRSEVWSFSHLTVVLLFLCFRLLIQPSLVASVPSNDN